jgi:quinol monooxygenase YgiN
VIVVVVETQVAAEQAERALEMARAGLRGTGPPPTGARQNRFFQGRDDPSHFVYLGTWESREAYEAAFDKRRRTDIEVSLPAPIVPRYFHPLAAYERVLLPMEMVALQIIEGPPSGAALTRAYLLELYEQRQSLGPELVLTMYCEEVDAPGRFLIVSGWQSAGALTAVSAVRGTEFFARMDAAGATVRRFYGVTRFDSLLSL